MTKSQREIALDRIKQLQDQLEHHFTEHPKQTGESYWQHLWFTTRMTLRMLYTSAALMIHGLFPFMLVRTASLQMEKMYLTMLTRKPKAKPEDEQYGAHI